MNMQFFKNNLSVSVALLLFFYIFKPGPSFAAPLKKKNQQLKTKIVIYNLNIREESKKFKYYSGIVPFSLAKNLREYGSYTVEHKQEVQIFRKNISGTKEKSAYIKSLKKLARSSGADYMITGACEITENTLIIDLQIYDVMGRELDYINKKSMESGVILKDTIDSLALDINESVIRSLAKNRVRFAPSPYLTFYKGLSVITFGINFGQVRLIGDWSDSVNDTDFVNSYIQFNLLKYLNVSAGAEFMAADNRNISSTFYNELLVWEFYLDLMFPMRFSRYFGIAFSLGGGAAISKIQEYSTSMGNDGPSPPDNTYRSKDATVRGGVSIFFDLGNLHLRFGSSFKRIFYDNGFFETSLNDEGPLDMYTVFAGVGYNI
jgi:hypothetical protein